MRQVEQIAGQSVALPLIGVDTDQIVPARFMSRPRDAGYGEHLFYDLRRTENGSLDPAFRLNAPAAQGAAILVAGAHFGSGSSREAAVYALVDAGFRAVIAESFGDIFHGNAVNNGLVPAQVHHDAIGPLMRAAEAGAQITLDLGVRRVAAPGIATTFSLDPTAYQKLSRGWDDIDMTLAQADAVREFAQTYERTRPWSVLKQAE